MNIELVDLKNQYLKIKKEVDAAVIDVMNSSKFIKGPAVQNFAKNLSSYLGGTYVIPCANGTDALQIALMALDLKPGDEVITPSFTYIATAEVIALLGLTAVFVDVDPQTFTLDPGALENAISDKTRAIIAVNLYGQCANLETIMQIAAAKQIPVIEDNAQAIGADYLFSDGSKKKSGTIAHIGTTSFFPSKNLGCYGDGGAMFTSDQTLAKKLTMIANHGQEKKYHHDIIGVNSRLDSIQAAILDIKLSHLEQYNISRNNVADAYNMAFENTSEIITPKVAEYSTHVFHQYTIVIKTNQRDQLKEHLTQKGIPANIYYPIPIHLQKGFLQVPNRKLDLTHTEYLMKHALSLPIHTEMTTAQLQYITRHVNEFFK